MKDANSFSKFVLPVCAVYSIFISPICIYNKSYNIKNTFGGIYCLYFTRHSIHLYVVISCKSWPCLWSLKGVIHFIILWLLEIFQTLKNFLVAWEL